MEAFEMMAGEQIGVIAVVAFLCVIVFVKVAKMVMKVVLMALLVGVGFLLFKEFEPTGLEKAAMKIENAGSKLGDKLLNK